MESRLIVLQARLSSRSRVVQLKALLLFQMIAIISLKWDESLDWAEREVARLFIL